MQDYYPGLAETEFMVCANCVKTGVFEVCQKYAASLLCLRYFYERKHIEDGYVLICGESPWRNV